jgi:hypothetical protein
MANQLKRGRYLATAKAQEQRLAFLLAAAEGDGDVSSLFALADWYSEHGADREAGDVRRCVERYASTEGGDLWPGMPGISWACWPTASRGRRRPSLDTSIGAVIPCCTTRLRRRLP